MEEQERAQNRHTLADQLAARAKEYEDDAKLVRTLFLRSDLGATDNEPETVPQDGEE
jgi:hypothetical protein